jgi:hypothetical protein
MYQEEKVSLTISIAKCYRDRLRTMAAQQNLHDPDQLTSASTLAREIICNHIDELERVEADFQAVDAMPSHERVGGQIEELVIKK